MTRSFSTLIVRRPRWLRLRCVRVTGEPDYDRCHRPSVSADHLGREPWLIIGRWSSPYLAGVSAFKPHSCTIPFRLTSNGCIECDPAIHFARLLWILAPARLRYSTTVYPLNPLECRINAAVSAETLIRSSRLRGYFRFCTTSATGSTPTPAQPVFGLKTMIR